MVVCWGPGTEATALVKLLSFFAFQYPMNSTPLSVRILEFVRSTPHSSKWARTI